MSLRVLFNDTMDAQQDNIDRYSLEISMCRGMPDTALEKLDKVLFESGAFKNIQYGCLYRDWSGFGLTIVFTLITNLISFRNIKNKPLTDVTKY
ncbi:MAG: hypothetical protein K5639_00500 [Eubacterium sp.]|nr:hypothetical protein [Eubacterium sp.]